MAGETPTGKTEWTRFLVLSVFLILRCLFFTLVPGGEWPLPPLHYISMGLDLLLTGALIYLRTRVSRMIPPADPRRRTSDLLFWPALAAGLFLLLIRFTSDAAWWTGHLRDGLVFG